MHIPRIKMYLQNRFVLSEDYIPGRRVSLPTSQQFRVYMLKLVTSPEFRFYEEHYE